MADLGAQGGTAHSTAEAEEWAKSLIRLANGPADDIVAGTMASGGPGPRAIIGVVVIASVLLTQAQLFLGGLAREIATYYGYGVSGLITMLVLERIRHPVYLTVTQDELICYRVRKMSQQPARAGVLFRAPSCAVRVHGSKDKKGRRWAIGFASRGPGAKGRLPQQHRIRAWLERLRLVFRQPLTVDRSWFRELGEVMTALQASGAEVQPALLDITAALTAAESPPPG
jgi:hypothetical protein